MYTDLCVDSWQKTEKKHIDLEKKYVAWVL